MRGHDLTGRKYGRLSAIKRTILNKHGQRLWLWRCDCGRELERDPGPIKQGRVVSCGCYQKEQARANAVHGKSSTRTYRAWIAMKARARGSDETNKKHYRDRGITVHPKWRKSFVSFLADMKECPPGLTLERIKNDEGYKPGNCRWATQGEQTRNTRRTVRVIVGRQTMCLKDACAVTGANYDAVRSRIRKGIPPQIALDGLAHSSPRVG